jgi:hypothetical protein
VPEDPRSADSIVVISGGAIGAASVRQLLRASGAGRLRARLVRVVDPDPACAAARFEGEHGGVRVSLEREEWVPWLTAHMGELSPTDQMVPYHFAPHIFRDWLEGELRGKGARVLHEDVPAQGVPFERVTGVGDRALSYATWICPPTCIEPALCPHTRGAKDWSLAGDLARSPGPGIPLVFPCLHFVYGVGTVPVGDLLEARRRLLDELGAKPRLYLVATSSHCHALSSMLRVDRPPVNSS